MPSIDLEVGEIAQDVAEQVADIVATAKTEQLLQESAEAEEGRVLAEQARVEAEAGRQAELDSKITFGSGWYDGSGGVASADYANDLISKTGLTVNDDPMSYGIVGGAQKSAVGDGNASLNKLVCVDVVKNQLLNGWVNFNQYNSSVTVSDGVVTMAHTSSSNAIYYKRFDYVFGHRYLILVDVLNDVAGKVMWNNNIYTQRWLTETVSNSWVTAIVYFNFASAPDSINPQFAISHTDASEGDTCKLRNPRVIDLTQRYGNNDVIDAIIGTGTDAEKVARLLAFDPEILSNLEYDAGTLVPSKTAKLLSVGVNQWDEEWENGTLDENGQAGTGTNVRAKNLIPVFPNTTYYAKTPKTITIAFYDSNKQPIVGAGVYKKDATFTTPNNCYYMRFALTSASDYGTTYNHDICINISDANINGKYYPYNANPVTLPNYEGHGILKVVDGKVVADGTELYPDGNSKKRYGTHTFTSADTIVGFNTDGSNCRFAMYISSKSSGSGTALPKLICDKADVITPTEWYNRTKSGFTIGVNGLGTLGRIQCAIIGVSTEEGAKAWLNGKTISYPLETEEDITTSVYQSTFPVEQGGTLQFLDENDNPIAGLQGSEILYAKSTNGAIQGLFNRGDINWNPENVASKTQLESKVDKVVDDLKNGNIIPRLAHDLTPYSDESGTFQDNPMISQGTGTDNNTAIVTTGNYAQLREKQGNTLAVNNQFNYAENFFPSGNLNTTHSKSGTSFTLSVNSNNTETYGAIGNSTWKSRLVSGHKYLIAFKFVSRSSDELVAVVKIGNGQEAYGTNLGMVYGVGTYQTGGNPQIVFGAERTLTTADSITVDEVICVDITSWPSDVIADLTAHPDHFGWYYNGSLDYNAGSLKNADGVKLVCTGRNLFGGEIEGGTYDGITGEKVTSVNNCRSSTKTLVTPNSKINLRWNISPTTILVYFYDKDENYIGYGLHNISQSTKTYVYETPSNCRYVSFAFYLSGSGWGTNPPSTQTTEAVLSLYYTEQEGGEGYDQHYDYEEPTVVDTGSEELLAFDRKLPDGTIERGTASGNITNLVYLRTTEQGLYLYRTAFDAKSNSYDFKNNLGLPVVASFNSATETEEKVQYSSVSYTFYILLKSNRSGDDLKFQYPLANPTTEQGTPFPENIDIDDYGMMYWLDENDNLVGIPQGAKFFYPVNYKGFTDDLYNRTDGDAGNVVIKSEQGAVNSQLKEALGGTLRQLLAATKSIDFANTDFVDLGDLDWSYVSNGSFFLASQLPVGAEVNNNIICSLYKAQAVSQDTPTINMIISLTSQLRVRNLSYTDATAFKAAMQGVLLAYEKA